VSETLSDANLDAGSANAAAVSAFTALDAGSIALLLDVDGTLIDIGPSPFEVDVSQTLKQSLARLMDLTGGALALVSGRPIRDLDRLLRAIGASGGRGSMARRCVLAKARVVSRVADLPVALRQRLIGAIDPRLGLEFEDKGYSVALHYRKAPEHEERLRAHVVAARAAFPAEDTEVLPGKMMIEVKRPGIDKGAGIRELMRHRPFAGRMPVFIGDDVTDEAAFAAMPALGGLGFSVSRVFDGLSGIFSAPAEVRRALQALAGAN